MNNPMHMRWGKLYKGTPAELAIEPAIAAIGLAYRTQLPGFLYGFRFFPDFFIPQLGIVIEIDDASHTRAEKILADADRTEELEKRGWRVLRTTNENALTDPFGAVKALLQEAGITPRDIDLARRKPVASCMPKPGKAPQKARREAKSADRQRRRAKPESARPAARKRPTPPPLPGGASSLPTP